jgi:hypothetical protein
MRNQGPAGWDDQGNRTTENEHIIPGAQIREMMTNPQTGQSDFTKSDYRNADTVRLERETALYKTHDGPESDNQRTADLKEQISDGGSVNLNRDLVEPSLDAAQRAADATSSAVTPEALNRGLLGEVGDIFDNQRLDDTAAKLQQFEAGEGGAATSPGDLTNLSDSQFSDKLDGAFVETAPGTPPATPPAPPPATPAATAPGTPPATPAATAPGTPPATPPAPAPSTPPGTPPATPPDLAGSSM